MVALLKINTWGVIMKKIIKRPTSKKIHFFILSCALTTFVLGAAYQVYAVDADLTGRPTIGPADAKVHIVEVSDFQCRHCAKVAPIIEEVLADYGDLVRFTVVTIAVNGPYSEMAAEFAYTAGDHGKFWEAHRLLFAHQSEISQDFLFKLGEQLGISADELKANFKNNAHRSLLRKNFMLVVDKLEIEYTPTMFINDQRSHGAKSADFYRYYINQELKKFGIASPVGEVPKPRQVERSARVTGTVSQDLIYPVPVLPPQDSVLKVKIGDMAPDFELPTIGMPGTTVKLSDFLGKKNVVLSFVPAAWTPACSAQWPEYYENKREIQDLDSVIIGISADNVPTLFSWAISMGMRPGMGWFTIASDFYPHGRVASMYGILRSDGVTERAVIVIDKQGKIRYIDVHDINTRPSVKVLLKELHKL